MGETSGMPVKLSNGGKTMRSNFTSESIIHPTEEPSPLQPTGVTHLGAKQVHEERSPTGRVVVDLVRAKVSPRHRDRLPAGPWLTLPFFPDWKTNDTRSLSLRSLTTTSWFTGPLCQVYPKLTQTFQTVFTSNLLHLAVRPYADGGRI